ncbi:MAG TPA: FtsX-like permease family protein [Candidatus Acidoferrum sp.]|nr:FtsX-like permease family protein [Candidatus Acidoferrum sp.]
MKTRDLTELAVRNLREALLRNSLTTLGVAVGVASLVAMLSLGVGLQTLASRRLLRSGLFDSVLVSSGRDNRGPGGPRRQREIAAKNAPTLDDDALQTFSKLPNVSEVYPQIRFSTEFRYAGNKFTTNALGVPESARKGEAFDGMTGKFFSSPDAEEAILQIELAQQIAETPAKNAADANTPQAAPNTAGETSAGKPGDAAAGTTTGNSVATAATAAPAGPAPEPKDLVGKTITIRYAERASFASAAERDDALLESAMTGQLSGGLSMVPKEKTLRIVGLVETDPSAGMGGFGGGRLFLPLKLAESLHVAQPSDMQALLSDTETKPAYTVVTVHVKNPKDVAAVEDAIKKMGYSAFSLLDATKGLRIVFTVFDLFLGLFGSLALTVASLGIINTLVMAILERRREIGVLKALGATDRDVKRLFFAEAAAMGFFGGLFGVALGWFIGLALTWGTGIYLRQQDLPSVKISYVPWWLALGAIAFATLVSLLAGLYPAARAARLNPVDALRYE